MSRHRSTLRGTAPNLRPVQLKLVSFLGLVSFLALAWACSYDRRKFPWRTVLSGIGLQIAFALFILHTSAGVALFQGAQGAFLSLINAAEKGAGMVFGPLANKPLLGEKLGPGNAFIFVITVSATIIVVSAISTLLYHYGILQRVVRGVAWVMCRVMGTSGSESLSAAANIFMGQTEAPLTIRPFLPNLTQSELFTIMVSGMAHVSGAVMAAYVKIAGVVHGYQAAGRDIDYVNRRNDLIRAVTLADVNRVIRRLLNPDAFTFVVVGQPEGLETPAAPAQ